MSLQVSQNLAAMSAHRWLKTNDASMAKAIERLSSGFRINSASDDAAGLVISENLRTQISGITQASKNVQDGINMFKTAEKALDGVETLLRNIRDLTLDAANSNGNTSKIAADQAQVSQALTSIDRTANQTEFAGLKLFDTTANGNIADKWFQIGANGNQTAQFTLGTYDGVALVGDLHANNAAGLNLTSGVAEGPKVVGQSAASAITGDETLSIAIHRSDGSNYALSVALADTTDIAGQVTAINTALTTAGINANFEAVRADSDGTTNVAGNYLKVQAKAGNTADQNAGAYITVSAAAGTDTGFRSSAPTTDYGDSGAIDLTTASTAADFNSIIAKVDAALKLINGLRVNLGAFQKNNLESSLSSLAVTKENLTASESSIRDTDMADEMVNFTKAQILMNAGQAMMTQANAAPQSILQMLR